LKLFVHRREPRRGESCLQRPGLRVEEFNFPEGSSNDCCVRPTNGSRCSRRVWRTCVG